MKTIFLKEIRNNLKSFLIWTLTVGLMGFYCITLYKSMEGDVASMADAFSNMGAFSDAFGMSTLSIATVEGFFATEVGTVHGLGGAMFAAILAIGIISKEEEGHSGEFILSLPVTRMSVVAAKGICVVLMLVLFTAVCTGFYVMGFAVLDADVPTKYLLTFMGMQLLMNLEIAGISFCISSLSGKNRMGLGIGIAMFLYIYDVMGRVVPDLKDALFVGPFSYANASDIFSGKDLLVSGIVLSLIVTILTSAFSFIWYNKRDIAS